MDVRLRALRLVDARDGRGGEDQDGYVLRDGRFPVVGEEGRVGVAEGIVGAVGVGGGGVVIVGGGGCVVWVQGRGRDGGRWAGGGQVVGYDGQREQGYVVFLRQADGGGRGGKGGAEGAVEGREGDAQVDGVVLDGGLDGVGFEDCVLVAAPGQWRRSGEWMMRICEAHYGEDPG